MNNYPAIYCPAGVERPACSRGAGAAIIEVLPGKGPDQGEKGGVCYGGGFHPGLKWTKTSAGWWLGLSGHRPQDTARLQPNPSVQSWRTIEGVQPDHQWRVPVLLAFDPATASYLSALDRVWKGGDDWATPDELTALQETLLAITRREPLHDDPRERHAAMLRLGIGLLAVGHHVDSDLLTAAGWLTERMIVEATQWAVNTAPPEDQVV